MCVVVIIRINNTYVWIGRKYSRLVLLTTAQHGLVQANLLGAMRVVGPTSEPFTDVGQKTVLIEIAGRE